jgi:hypothetical protein
MRDFPRKNCLVAGSMAMFSAACFAGAACFYAKSPQQGLMALYIVLAIGQASFGIFLFKKSKKSV